MAGLDLIFRDTITLFNRHGSEENYVWTPMVIHSAHFVDDKAAMIGSYGEQTQDNAMIHILYQCKGNDAIINKKRYVDPKEYMRMADISKVFTFAYGDEFDFIYGGVWGSSENIYDDDYPRGFFDYMNKLYDKVYAISAVTKRNLIPHFEITAR